MTKQQMELAMRDTEGRARSALARTMCRYYEHETAGGFELTRANEWGFIRELCRIIGGMDVDSLSGKMRSWLRLPMSSALVQITDYAWDGYKIQPNPFSTEWDDWDGISGGV